MFNIQNARLVRNSIIIDSNEATIHVYQIKICYLLNIEKLCAFTAILIGSNLAFMNE